MRVEGVGDVDLRGNVALGKETMNATALWQSGVGMIESKVHSENIFNLLAIL